ncbi:RNA recognition motif domain [Macleaya cordata]|uniref:RNA recognition motif domain n=1 Tax=Macleaya cordata TaxID=56857 RepID=A0A200PQB5_MACCD|nr:RNA recognition motif domain [Macleaya cordata]
MAKKRKVDEEENTIDAEPEMDTEVDSDEEEEDITKLLEPFNKEQLIDIIRTASSEHPKIIEEIHRIADLDPAHRKLFVHGLGWETTSEKLRDFFSKYGELEDCNVVVDKSTGKSKGYGFLLFKHRKSAQKALKEPQKKIESRMTACQLASSGPVNPSHPQQQQQQQQQQMHSNFHSSQDTLQRKIYVGNVHSEIPTDKLLTFFSKYGEIEEGPLGFDKQTGKPKGYALFIYKTVEGARKALEEPSKSFDGHQLYCQKATDSHKLKSASTSASAPAGNLPAGDGFNPVGNVGGYNPPAGAGFNTQNGVMGHQALLGQGLMAGAQPFGQGIQPIQAALAVLAAAGQNPAAFGVSPAVMNPALAGFNPASVPPTMQPAMAGFGMGNPGYQNPQAHQVNTSYQGVPTGHGPATRPPPAMGPMGGYVAR